MIGTPIVGRLLEEEEARQGLSQLADIGADPTSVSF